MHERIDDDVDDCLAAISDANKEKISRRESRLYGSISESRLNIHVRTPAVDSMVLILFSA